MNRGTRRQFLQRAGLAAGALALPTTLSIPRTVDASEDNNIGLSGLYAQIQEADEAPPDYQPWWVQVFLPTRLWPTQEELDNPVGKADFGQYFRVEVPQNGPRLQVWNPRNDELVYIGAEAVGPVDPPRWAQYLEGRDGRWIDVTLSVPQNAVAMRGDVRVYRALVTAGLQGSTKPGHYNILRRVYNETMDSRTIPGLRDSYLLKNVLFTQYFHWDGSAIHYNWWGPPYGFGRPGSHGCLGMMYNDSKYFWDWADIGVPVIIHS